MKSFSILLLLFFLSACSAVNVANIVKDELTKSSHVTSNSLLIEPPYEINGKWFYPKNYKSFNQIGVASKVQNLEIGSKTTNGERYHPDILSGAHASLPLPSMVLVTNVENGYTVNVRINQRGGYSNINTIELSPAVFDLLEMNNSVGIVEINLISQNETFILKEAKTYNAEKKVEKAPVSSVSIETIDIIENDGDDDDKAQSNEKVNELVIREVYNGEIYLNIAKFSFKKSALSFKDDLKNDVKLDIFETFENNKKYFNVVLGPFDDVNTLYDMHKNDTFSSYEDLFLIIL